MVSDLAYRVIDSAIKIRLDRNEDTLENILANYPKLSDKQKQTLTNKYKNYSSTNN